MTAPGPILLVHGDRRVHRLAQRVLGATEREVTVAGDADGARRCVRERAPDLVVAGAEAYLDGGADDVAAEAIRRGARGCVVLADEPRRDVPRLLEHDGVAHVVAAAMPALADELITAAQRLLRGDPFGIDKDLAWGTALHATAVATVGDRHRVMAELVAFVAGLGLPARTQAQAMLIADELIANAIHHAPVDADGLPYLRDVPRDADRALAPRERARVRWGCDARYLAIEVADAFGSLAPATIRRHLAKAGGGAGGAGPLGLGLAMAYATSSQLSFALAPGERTEVSALVDVRGGAPAAAPSFHLFDAAPAAAARDGGGPG